MTKETLILINAIIAQVEENHQKMKALDDENKKLLAAAKALMGRA